MDRTRYTNPWVPEGHTHVTEDIQVDVMQEDRMSKLFKVTLGLYVHYLLLCISYNIQNIILHLPYCVVPLCSQETGFESEHLLISENSTPS
jgi:hypothetical protein